MPKMDYQKLRDQIEDRYRRDLEALERIKSLLEEPGTTAIETSPEPKRRGPKKWNSHSDAMKAAWARRKAGKSHGDERGLSAKAFSKFLVKDPSDSNGNG